MFWFWIFFFYSLAGYGLEKLYALVTHARHRVRKCFLLLPLCPVYGLAMAAVLYLAGDTESFWQLALYGGILCTAVEYAVHFYMKMPGCPVLGLQRHLSGSQPPDLLPLRRGLGAAVGSGGAVCAAPAGSGHRCHTARDVPGGSAAADGGQLLHRAPAAAQRQHRPAGAEKPVAGAAPGLMSPEAETPERVWVRYSATASGGCRHIPSAAWTSR